MLKLWLLMQLVPAVTELVISELLWLNFSSPEKPVYVYLHSIGSQTPDGQAVGFDTEAYAILDTLAYIRPEIHTLVLGQVRMIPDTCSSTASAPWLAKLASSALNGFLTRLLVTCRVLASFFRSRSAQI